MTKSTFLRTLRSVARTHRRPSGIPGRELANRLGVAWPTVNHWLHHPAASPARLSIVALEPLLARIVEEQRIKKQNGAQPKTSSNFGRAATYQPMPITEVV